MSSDTPLPKTQRMLIGMVLDGMRRRELNQEELHKLTGLSTPYISQLLTGVRPGRPGTWDLLLNAVRSDYNGFGSAKPLPGRRKEGVDARTHWAQDPHEPKSAPQREREFEAL